MRDRFNIRKIRNGIVNYIKNIYKRFIKFGIIGFIGTIVEFGVFFILVLLLKETRIELLLNYIIPAIAFEISLINNFLFSYFWAWKDKQGNLLLQFMKYQLTYTFSFFIRLAIFNFTIYILHITAETNFLLFNFIYMTAFILVIIFNFLIINTHVFKVRTDNHRGK